MAKSGIRSSGSSKSGKSRSPALSKARSAASSRRGARGVTSDATITVVSRDDLKPMKGKTDWARVDALGDADIAEMVRDDPDAVPVDFDWSEAVLVIPPKKKAISIRVDEDVLDWFRGEGAGYQRRMNAVLRSYVEQRKKKRARGDGRGASRRLQAPSPCPSPTRGEGTNAATHEVRGPALTPLLASPTISAFGENRAPLFSPSRGERGARGSRLPLSLSPCGRGLFRLASRRRA